MMSTQRLTQRIIDSILCLTRKSLLLALYMYESTLKLLNEFVHHYTVNTWTK